ncbi:hypothetical protein V8C86DRAFT_2468333 [Haematococcus lacustris]|nr:hypothetical protein QJQ45_008198 [Haematococcus lacustris]
MLAEEQQASHAYVARAPLPEFWVHLGESTAALFHRLFGVSIPYYEGLMLILSISVMAVSIGIWIWIDIGNRRDRYDLPPSRFSSAVTVAGTDTITAAKKAS